jgi:hypothetical protein
MFYNTIEFADITKQSIVFRIGGHVANIAEIAYKKG